VRQLVSQCRQLGFGRYEAPESIPGKYSDVSDTCLSSFRNSSPQRGQAECGVRPAEAFAALLDLNIFRSRKHFKEGRAKTWKASVCGEVSLGNRFDERSEKVPRILMLIAGDGKREDGRPHTPAYRSFITREEHQLPTPKKG
jgi:hypothetical protein